MSDVSDIIHNIGYDIGNDILPDIPCLCFVQQGLMPALDSDGRSDPGKLNGSLEASSTPACTSVVVKTILWLTRSGTWSVRGAWTMCCVGKISIDNEFCRGGA